MSKSAPQKFEFIISAVREDRLNSPITRLSPTESQVASLVRQGRKTKEIAALMDVAAKTIDLHRFNIRCKLGLGSKGLNLRAYLASLPEGALSPPS